MQLKSLRLYSPSALNSLLAVLESAAARKKAEANAANAASRPYPDLLAWCRDALSYEGLAPAAHHRLLIRELAMVASGETERLMIFMPPGSAKSKYTSVLFPTWLMGTRPGMNIIAASHTAALALRFSSWVQRLVRLHPDVLRYGLRNEATARWETDNGGEYLAAGVGKAIPGFRADVAIIDDPIAGRQAADSETDRENVWEWYNGSLGPRLKPGARIILMHTRWNVDDLAGRLLLSEPERWRVVRIPAQADSVDDLLGRPIGEYLWADDSYGFADMLAAKKQELQRLGAMREWSSQYQQDPRPGEGTLFKPEQMRVVDALPVGGQFVRAWDLAATAETGTRDPDWTVGLKLGRWGDASYIIADVVRVRGGPTEVVQAIVATATQDGVPCRISLPQDPGQAGKAQVAFLIGQLAGFHVESTPETGDKATRAAPAASQANVGNIGILRSGWNRALLEELRDFPAGAKDDQVDALSRAFGMLSETRRPWIVPKALWKRL